MRLKAQLASSLLLTKSLAAKLARVVASKSASDRGAATLTITWIIFSSLLIILRDEYYFPPQDTPAYRRLKAILLGCDYNLHLCAPFLRGESVAGLGLESRCNGLN